jgi:TonB family protein
MNLLVRLIPTIGFAVLFSTVCFAGNKQDEGESLIRRVEQISDIRFADARPFRLKANFTLLGDGVATGSEGIEVRVLELLSEPSPDSASFVPPVGAKEQASCSGKLQAPRALYTPQPDYPINEPLPGSPVVIWLIVGVDGKPHDLKIIRSLGKTFDDRALAAVGRWTFKPSMCDGDPVPVQINVEMAF